MSIHQTTKVVDMNKTIVYAVIGSAVVISNGFVAFSVSDVKQEVREIRGQVAELKQEIVLYKSNETVKFTKAEQQCLAKNIFYEAGIESHAGKIAVAQVTNNRLKTGRWGKDICKVVYSKAQFSWTLEKKKKFATPKGKLWTESQQAAADFQQGIRVRDLEKSKFYHTSYIRTPKWADKNKKVHEVGQHIFYTTAKQA